MGKELRYLNRKELVEIIYRLKKSEQELQEENERLRAELDSKRITVAKAGSVADVAAALTNIFDTAQNVADVYLAEIEQRYKELEDAVAQRDAALAEARSAYMLLQEYEAKIELRKKELSSDNCEE